MNREPHFYIVDTAKGNWQKVIIPHEPASKVFSEKKELSEKQMTNEGELLRFIRYLKQKGKTGVRYMNVLEEYIQKNDVPEEVFNLIVEVLQ